MLIAAVLLLIVNLAGLGFVIHLHRGLVVRERALGERLQQIDEFEPLSAAFERSYLAGRKRVIVVEILNPLELAAGQHRLAGIAGGLAPAAIRKVVYDQAARITREKLAELDVQATVEVHAAD